MRWVMMAMLVLSASVADATGPVLNHCGFTWTETNVTTVVAFNLKIATTSGGPYTTLVNVPISGSGPDYSTTGNMCVGVSDGQKFAIVTALDAATNESGGSPEVPFVLLTVAPAAPTNLGVH